MSIYSTFVHSRIYTACRYRPPFTWLRVGMGLVIRDIRKLPVDTFTNLGAFSYSRNGWHPYTAVLKQMDQNPDLLAGDSVLPEFYERFTPDTREGFLPVHSNADWQSTKMCYIPPWGGGKIVNCDDWFELWTGPKSNESIDFLFNRLKNLYSRLKNEGYRPWAHPDGYIGVCVLKKSDTDFRCLVISGQDRASIVSHLGYKSVWVRVYPTGPGFPANMPHKINLSKINKWPGLKSGDFISRDAVGFFNAYFEYNGKQQAAELGLL